MPHFPLSIRVIAVGRLRGSVFEAAGREYLARLRHYVAIEIIEVKTSLGRGKPEAQAMIAEGRELQSRFRAEAHRIVLHMSGREASSKSFAQRLQRLAQMGARQVDFIVGGAAGLSPEVLQAAHESMALSQMTLPHELARVVLLEQLYRACTIWRGEKYHK